MAKDSNPQSAFSKLRVAAIELLRWFGSLKLAVFLIATLAVVLSVATFVETANGREYAQWHVYHSRWFAALLALLAVNIAASASLRFPWRKKHIGFLVTHGGLLVLLAGALQTFYAGIEGHLVFEEGQMADGISITDRCQFTASWQGQRSSRGPRRIVFIFQAGPADWPDGKTLDVGQLGGVGVEVLKFYRHARVEESWVEDPRKSGAPAIRLATSGPDARSAREEWLVADAFGSQVFLGPVKVEFQRASMDSMLEDFLKPPAANSDKDGVLSIHFDGKMQRIPVSKSVGKKIPVGDGKVHVEIAEYMPNAKPGQGGKFTTRGNDPLNPLLEIRVHQSDKEQPQRQIAFAKLPFLNLDGMHGWSCPVKFWYHHPAVTPEPGVELLQTSDGKLHCRVSRDGKYQPRASVKIDEPIDVAEPVKIVLTEHLPSARRDVSFRPLEMGSEEGGPESAALVKVSAGGAAREIWMQRNHPEFGSQKIQTPEGVLDFSFGNERLPLGFALRLERFERGLNPGRMGAASFASYVRLTDPHRDVDEDHKISMNEPLTYDKFTFYQSSYQEQQNGKMVSILSAAYDPGQFLKYLGSVLVCVGIVLISSGKYQTFGKIATRMTKRLSAAGDPARRRPEATDNRPAIQKVSN